MKSRIFLTSALTALLVGGSLSVDAKVARRDVNTVVQPDGTEIRVKAFGGPRSHYYTTEDGYLLTTDENGIFYFAERGNTGIVTRSKYKATDAAKRSVEVKNFLSNIDKSAMIEEYATQRKSATRRAAAGPGLFPGTAFPSTGSPKALVVLVQYTDQKFMVADPLDYFTRMLTQEGFKDNGATGSATDFFVSNSMGLFTPEFDVYGPITLKNKQSYYGGNDMWGNDKAAEEMIIEACQQLDATVDLSQYDCDGDGYIDNVYAFYAGYGEADSSISNTVWPHSWDIEDGGIGTFVFDGVKLNRYACSNETDYQTRKPDGIGTFVHEFSHVMGLPDLYATDYSSAYTPGEWSTLDYGPYNNGGMTPPAYGAFERHALGWIDPIIISGPLDGEMGHIFTENKCYKIPTSKENEYFLLENRQQSSWDKYIPGHGMLIWHIDYNQSVWTNNTVNNSASHQYVDLEEAKGKVSDRAYDPFPGKGNVTSFTDDTKPSMKTWAGAALNLPITDIAETNGIITFKVAGGSQEPQPVDEFTEKSVVLAEPTEVAASSVRINWLPLEDATEYFVNFYAEGTLAQELAHLTFDGCSKNSVTLPDGWTTNATTGYESDEYSGESAPALQLKAEGAYIESPEYDDNISSVKFWHRGASTSGSTFTVAFKVDGEWADYQEYTPTTSKTEGNLIEISNVPAGAKAMRITYHKDKGNTAFDDIVVMSGGAGAILTDFSVGDETTLRVDNLESETTYHYTVHASNGNVNSQKSEIGTVTTKESSSLADVNEQRVSISMLGRTAQIFAPEGTSVTVNDISGRTLLRAKSTGVVTRVTFPAAGIYLIKAGNIVEKVIIR